MIKFYVPSACHLPDEVGIWIRHRRWHADGPLSGSVTSVPIPSRDGSGWQSTGGFLWVYKYGNHGARTSCWWFSGQPSFHTNSSSTPPKPKHCQTILTKAWVWWDVVFWGSSEDLPGTNFPVAACLRRTQLMVARIRPMWPAIAPCRMPQRASACTSCLVPVGVVRGVIRTISENREPLLIRTCHSVKEDFGKLPPKLRFWT